MLTMHSFMFINSCGNLCSNLREHVRMDTLDHLGPGLFAVGNPGTLQTAAYVLSLEPTEQARSDSVGTYVRLVKELDGEAKRRRFEQGLASLFTGQPDPVVYHYRQGGFDAISGSPWVYWITPGLRRLFQTLPNLATVAEPRVGLQTSDNFRFLRYWWEVGRDRIGFGCCNTAEAQTSGRRWFPYMKGGAFRRWYGNQEYVVNWGKDGAEIKNLGIENGRVASRPQNTEFYFRRGVIYSHLSSSAISFRYMPGGFIFDQSGSSIFFEDPLHLLSCLNSTFVLFGKKVLNPTVNFQVGSLGNIPVPKETSTSLVESVRHLLEIFKFQAKENEIIFDFIAPLLWETGIDDVSDRHRKLAKIEHEIDEEVYRLYSISEKDRAAIEAELAEPTANDATDDESDDSSSDIEDADMAAEASLTLSELARLWISYAVGIVMGRFQPGIDGALGRGHFSAETAAKLRALADSDWIVVLDQGHADDLATKILQVLQIMLGDEVTAEVVAVGTGRAGNPGEELHRYFERSFFKEHIQKYRKRPIYWLLQSPRKTYGVWLFHEKLTKDTLYRIRGEQYVASRIRLLEAHIADLRRQREAAQGRERRALEKQVAEIDDVLDDLRAFAERIDAILQCGYTPHIDDGVLINIVPLWELMPSWQAEPKKCGDALARGDYDWSHQAMDHWPERVRKKCQTNRSYVIAHGLA